MPLAPPARSAVSATIAEITPGIALTASSTCLRIGSQALTSAASTLSEKNTFPSVTTISDRTPLSVSFTPPGEAMDASRSRI